LVVQFAWPSFCRGSVLFSSLDHILQAAALSSPVAVVTLPPRPGDGADNARMAAAIITFHIVVLKQIMLVDSRYRSHNTMQHRPQTALTLEMQRKLRQLVDLRRRRRRGSAQKCSWPANSGAAVS
jgi:hypothetical protein